MSVVKCFDIVSALIDNASKNISPFWKLNTERETILKQDCAMIDLLVKEFGGISLEVTIDETTTDIIISLMSGDLVVESKDHVFHTVVSHAKRVSFRNALEEAEVQTDFIFRGVWDATDWRCLCE